MCRVFLVFTFTKITDEIELFFRKFETSLAIQCFTMKKVWRYHSANFEGKLILPHLYRITLFEVTVHVVYSTTPLLVICQQIVLSFYPPLETPIVGIFSRCCSLLISPLFSPWLSLLGGATGERDRQQTANRGAKPRHVLLSLLNCA